MCWGYLFSDSHFWFFSEVDFQLSFPGLLAPWYENCICHKDSPNWPLACITEGHTSLFPWGLRPFMCRSMGRFWVRLWNAAGIFHEWPGSLLLWRLRWSWIYRDASASIFLFLAMISMETAGPSSPSVLAAYSSLKSSLMKDGSPKVHKFDLHSHSKFEYPSEFLWPGNQVREAMRPCPHGRFLWINLSLSLFSDQLETNYKKMLSYFSFLCFIGAIIL